jgi:hypothetical protein
LVATLRLWLRLRRYREARGILRYEIRCWLRERLRRLTDSVGVQICVEMAAIFDVFEVHLRRYVGICRGSKLYKSFSSIFCI